MRLSCESCLERETSPCGTAFPLHLHVGRDLLPVFAKHLRVAVLLFRWACGNLILGENAARLALAIHAALEFVVSDAMLGKAVVSDRR